MTDAGPTGSAGFHEGAFGAAPDFWGASHIRAPTYGSPRKGATHGDRDEQYTRAQKTLLGIVQYIALLFVINFKTFVRRLFVSKDALSLADADSITNSPMVALNKES